MSQRSEGIIRPMKATSKGLHVLFIDDSHTGPTSLGRLLHGSTSAISVCHCNDPGSVLNALHLSTFDAIIVNGDSVSFNARSRLSADFLHTVAGRQPGLPIIILAHDQNIGEELRSLSDKGEIAILSNDIVTDLELRSIVQRYTTAPARLSSVSISESGKLTPHDVQDIIDRERQFRLLLNNNPLPLFVYDANSLAIKDVNTAALEMYGYSLEQFTRLTFPDLHIEEEAAALREQLTCPASRLVDRKIWHHRRADGACLEVEIITHPFIWNGHDVVLAFVRDISRQRHTEAKSREALDQHKMLFDNSPLPMWVYETDSLAIVEVNAAASAHYGYSRSEFLRMKASDLFVSHVQTPAGDMQATKNGSASVFRHRTKHGAEIDVEITASTITFHGKKARLVTAQNITDRLRAEAEAERNHELYCKLIDEDITALYICKPDGSLLVCNQEFARMFGFSGPEEVMSVNTERFFFSKEDREQFFALLRKRKALYHHELRLQRRDGTPIYVRANIVGRFDADDNLTEIAGYMFDITERRALEESLRQMQKMESIGTLAGGIAHDFNNILSIIHGNVVLMHESPDDRDGAARRLTTIEKAVDRGTRLVRQLLTFARKTPVEAEALNVNVEVKEMVRLLSETFPKTIELHCTTPSAALYIEADRNQLQQALLNLCVNARDAVLTGKGRGKITIAVELKDLVETRAYFHEARHPAYVTIRVTDNGRGMDDATQARVFEPFFTTKESGTGLGLSVVYGVARSLQGYVHVKSTLGQGSTFTLHIPAAAQHCTPKEESGPAPAIVKEGKETILVVEDEIMLLELVTEALRNKGYTVLTATDGDSAIALFQKHMGTIALVVSDKGLPKQSGIEVFMQIKQLAPQTKGIVMSGYLQPEERAMLEHQGIDAIIEKPFLSQNLVQRVREVLDAK